ncbi:MAG: phage portal protein [Proteobacteria bacterium]|nr:phage portal protein [Pseudomonadota bacterium]
MKKFFQNIKSSLATKIKKTPNNMMAIGTVGRPVFTPRNYEQLADEGYQRNVIVYRCISLIARGLASVPWLLYQQTHKGEVELERHPLLDLLNCPSPRQAGSSFMECLVSHLHLSGNAYLLAVQNESGDVCELHSLRPDRMTIIPDCNGHVQAYEYTVGGKKRTYVVDEESGQSQILHIKLFHPLHDWYGLSPIEAAACSIDQHNAVSAHNLALMQNGGRPSGAFIIKPSSHSMPLTDTQRDQLREDLHRLYEGTKNAGRILMMEGDFAWQDMGLSPKDLDFIAGKSVSAREICQAFGVPPILAGIPGDATFANYREARFHLWEDTILPLLDYLVAEFNLWLTPFFGANLRLGYDHDGIPALSPKREAAWAKICASDFLTINEKRQAVGYSPIEGGDRFALKIQ